AHRKQYPFSLSLWRAAKVTFCISSLHLLFSWKCLKTSLLLCSSIKVFCHQYLTASLFLKSNFMRQECLDSRFVFDRPLPVSRLVSLIGSKTQIPTQRYGRRPYGVGLLIAGYDDMGPHIFQTCPSANYFDCKAMSIGARSQSARTYLERHMEAFLDCNLNELVQHGLRALRETLPAEQDLTTKNVSIGIVGKEMEFTIYDDDDVASFLEGLEERPQRRVAQPADEAAPAVPDEPMEH
uniref:Proteasome subunit alpha type-1-like n=1 Tax=Sinocyclocheilus grahami TaxID=75366 RepID=A0A672L3J5_SINGR